MYTANKPNFLQKHICFARFNIGARYKSKSSTNWLNRQKTDIHTVQSKLENYRSRAAYKLIEINDKFRLINNSSRNILDLGFAPGAWTQVVLNEIKRQNIMSRVLGVDLINCSPPPGSSFIQGDIFSKKTHQNIREFFDDGTEAPVNLILSDMMANTSGIKDNDHYASMDLCDGVLVLLCQLLQKDGNLVMKFYTGKEDVLMKNKLQKVFRKVHMMKPQACRNELREMYFIGLKKKASNLLIRDIFS